MDKIPLIRCTEIKTLQIFLTLRQKKHLSIDTLLSIQNEGISILNFEMDFLREFLSDSWNKDWWNLENLRNIILRTEFKSDENFLKSPGNG